MLETVIDDLKLIDKLNLRSIPKDDIMEFYQRYYKITGKIKKDKLVEQIRERYANNKRFKAAVIEWYKSGEFDCFDHGHSMVHDADEGTKKRWVDNFIRHNLTNYDEVLLDLSKGLQRHFFYYDVLQKFESAIKEVYPDYEGKIG